MTELTLHLLAGAYCALPRARSERSLLATSHRAQIVEVIERRLGDPQLAPGVIAAELRMTPSYLHRVFAADQAETVAQYILRRRLEASAEALKDSSQQHRSITAIAFGLGFNSLSHFCRAFRARYELTPSDYRHS